MGLNIKNPRVEDNIRRLAERTGSSLTDAIDHAVVSELQRLDEEARTRSAAVPLKDRLQPLLDDLAKTRLDWRGSREIMEEVDDENGLPK